jgi:hypothetical protein
MATGPEHYREAEAKLGLAAKISRPDSGHSDEDATRLVGLALQRAQVHATLALAAATALNLPHPEGGFTVPDWEAWTDTASAYKRPAPAATKAKA